MVTFYLSQNVDAFKITIVFVSFPVDSLICTLYYFILITTSGEIRHVSQFIFTL